jgi:hypothetical protein
MPTTADLPLTVTVFHACKPDKHFGDGGCVHGNAVVTEKKPPAGDWNLLYELHVPTSTIAQEGKVEGDRVGDSEELADAGQFFVTSPTRPAPHSEHRP